jgi:hypothetical protein
MACEREIPTSQSSQRTKQQQADSVEMHSTEISFNKYLKTWIIF